MSYCAFGETSSWWRVYASASEVYVWRATFKGLRIETADDLHPFVKAFGRAQNMSLDVRGVCAQPVSGDSYIVDVVYTARITAPTPIIGADDADDVLEIVKEDVDFSKRYTSIQVDNPQWLQLVGPKNSLDFWLSQPVLWDANLGTRSWGRGGGPTSSWTDMKGLFLGSSEFVDGLKPLSPKLGGGFSPPGLNQDSNNKNIGLTVVALAAIVGGAWFIGNSVSKGARK